MRAVILKKSYFNKACEEGKLNKASTKIKIGDVRENQILFNMNKK